jgi:formate dehydrogenase maturation protein FdhE
MRNNGKGGMTTVGAHYSIICPKCGKPAARMERTPDGERYMHFTKKGFVWHMVTDACQKCRASGDTKVCVDKKSVYVCPHYEAAQAASKEANNE